jgi:CelD/BcsL family acetyltransferase involved in cellulose biosynthesis
MVRLVRSLWHETGATGLVQRARVEPTSALVLEAVRTPEAVRRLAPEWRALWEAASPGASIFQSFEWAAACVARLEPGTRPCVLVARAGGRLVAVAPLMSEQRLGLATLRWLGGSLAIYGDVLADASVDVPGWLCSAFDELARQGEAHSLLLESVRADARVATFLEECARKGSTKSAPWIDLAELGSFKSWRRRQSRTTRRSRARRSRQLEAAGQVDFVFDRTDADAAMRISELFAMKREWADKRHVISRTINVRSYEEIVVALASRESGLDARFSALRLDGKVIACELGFVVGGNYASYIGAYDPMLEAFSPGMLQIERTIEACFAEGLAVFDLQPPADAYKQGLACKEAQVSSFTIALTRMGRLQTLVAGVDHVALAKSAIGLMPAPCRRIVYAAMNFASRHETRQGAAESRSATSRILRRLLLLGAGAAIATIVVD